MAGLIEAKALSVGIGGRAVLSGLGLRLDAGQVLCVLGPNGAGKTTLFRTLLGLLPRLGGTLSLGGRPIEGLRRSEIAHLVAHVPQSLNLPFAYTAHDIVLMGAAARLGPYARPGAAEAERTREALAQLSISDLADQPIQKLSGGQRQMVLIARALAQGSQAVIFDEPTASLDLANRLRIERTVAKLAALGIGVILSSHDPDQAAALADEVLLVARGSCHGHGTPDEMLTDARLARLYGVSLEDLRRR